jgi:hypothetical protein
MAMGFLRQQTRYCIDVNTMISMSGSQHGNYSWMWCDGHGKVSAEMGWRDEMAGLNEAAAAPSVSATESAERQHVFRSRCIAKPRQPRAQSNIRQQTRDSLAQFHTRRGIHAPEIPATLMIPISP